MLCRNLLAHSLCLGQLQTILLHPFLSPLWQHYLPSDEGNGLDYLMVLSLSSISLEISYEIVTSYDIFPATHNFSRAVIPTSWRHGEAVAHGCWFTAQSQHSGILFDSVPVVLLPLCLLFPAVTISFTCPHSPSPGHCLVSVHWFCLA